ncbi:hypothetical protein RAA17_12900 [Komagataeibacter rhaeticus]|nr:hypothetical protein [Komagataeibacter rhaeticus]
MEDQGPAINATNCRFLVVKIDAGIVHVIFRDTDLHIIQPPLVFMKFRMGNDPVENTDFRNFVYVFQIHPPPWIDFGIGMKAEPAGGLAHECPAGVIFRLRAMGPDGA